MTSIAAAVSSQTWKQGSCQRLEKRGVGFLRNSVVQWGQEAAGGEGREGWMDPRWSGTVQFLTVWRSLREGRKGLGVGRGAPCLSPPINIMRGDGFKRR